MWGWGPRGWAPAHQWARYGLFFPAGSKALRNLVYGSPFPVWLSHQKGGTALSFLPCLSSQNTRETGTANRRPFGSDPVCPTISIRDQKNTLYGLPAELLPELHQSSWLRAAGLPAGSAWLGWLASGSGLEAPQDRKTGCPGGLLQELLSRVSHSATLQRGQKTCPLGVHYGKWPQNISQRCFPRIPASPGSLARASASLLVICIRLNWPEPGTQ